MSVGVTDACVWGYRCFLGLWLGFCLDDWVGRCILWLEVRFASGGQRLPLRFGICGLLCVLR